jgi:hypothetical protein
VNKVRNGCALIGLLLAVTGCGVGVSGHPELLPASVVPAPTPSAKRADATTRTAPVYFAKNDRLIAVDRGIDDTRRVASAFAAVVAGPTDAEKQAGIRTAVSADLAPDIRTDAGVTVIALRRDALEVPAGVQVLAVAQLVWSATTPPGSPQRIRFTDGADPIAVPVDGGRLESRAVGRADYRSVAPR